MDVEKFSTGPCPIGRTLALVGDGWSLMILRDVGRGLTRFEEFRASLGIAPNILARRLRRLTASGLLEKRRYSERPKREEYVITQAGRDFLPVLHVLGDWAHRHGGGGRLSRVVDAATGVRIEPVVIDGVTGAPLGTRPLTLVMPPEAEAG